MLMVSFKSLPMLLSLLPPSPSSLIVFFFFLFLLRLVLVRVCVAAVAVAVVVVSFLLVFLFSLLRVFFRLLLSSGVMEWNSETGFKGHQDELSMDWWQFADIWAGCYHNDCR